MAKKQKIQMTNQMSIAIMCLAIAITLLLGILVFTEGESSPENKPTPTPIYADSIPTATPDAGGSEGVSGPTATPTPTPAAPTFRPDAQYGKEQGTLYVVEGEPDSQIFNRKVVNGSISWQDADLDRLVEGSYFNLVSEESSGYYIMYNGNQWYMDKSWPSGDISFKPVAAEDAYYHMELTSIFTYSNINNRKIFTLFGTCDSTSSQWNLVTIENQDKGFKVTSRNYTESYSADGLTYTITFKDANNLLTPGQYIIDDQWYWTATVTAGTGTDKTVTLVSKKPMVYVVAAHGTYKQTIISAYEKPQDNIITVFVDAGHGGIDWGACYTPEGSSVIAREAVLNLAIAKRVTELLRQNGYQVYTTRDSEIYPGLFETAYLANAVEADLFVSIHQNVDTSNLSRNGVTTYYQKVLGNDTDGTVRDMKPAEAYALGQTLANCIHNKFVATTGAANLGVVGDNWCVTRETKMPAILIECGFMTNSAELNNLISDSYIEKEAQAIYAGILDYLQTTAQ